MNEDAEEHDEFIERYRKQLTYADDYVQIILNGHLELETALDDFLSELFPRPSYLDEAGLRFYQKVQLVRAGTEQAHDGPQWKLLLVINKARNDLSHRSKTKDVKIDMAELRNLLVQFNLKGIDVAALSQHDVLVHAIALASGYLVILRDQVRLAQGLEPLSEDEKETPNGRED